MTFDEFILGNQLSRHFVEKVRKKFEGCESNFFHSSCHSLSFEPFSVLQLLFQLLRRKILSPFIFFPLSLENPLCFLNCSSVATHQLNINTPLQLFPTNDQIKSNFWTSVLPSNWYLHRNYVPYFYLAKSKSIFHLNHLQLNRFLSRGNKSTARIISLYSDIV